MIDSTLQPGDPCPRCASRRKPCCVLYERLGDGDQTHLACSGQCDDGGHHDNEPEWIGWVGEVYECTAEARHKERHDALLKRARHVEARLAELLKPRDAHAAAVPDDLRALGWSVGVHNDYVLNGRRCTFWLLTHPTGRYLRGEGESDLEALNRIRDQLENDKWVA